MARVADVTTPTLLLHGDADIRAPSGRRAVACRRRELAIDTRLVRYPGASICSFSTACRHIESTTTSGGGLGGAVRKRDQAAEDRPELLTQGTGSGASRVAERHKVPGLRSASCGSAVVGTR